MGRRNYARYRAGSEFTTIGRASTEYVLGGRSTGISFEKSSLAFLRMETQIDLRLDSEFRFSGRAKKLGEWLVDSANNG